MSKFKQILKALAGTALNIPDGELTALLEKAEDEIDVDAVSKALKDKYRENLNVFGKTQKDEGFKAAERSTSKKFEDALKTKFSISSDKIGDELVDEIFAAAAKKADPGKHTEDQIKLSDAYIKMENAYKAQLKKAQEESAQQVESLKKDYSRKENFAKVSSILDTFWESEGFVFDEDPIRASNKKQDLKEKFAGYDYEIKGDQIIALKDGKPIENEFGHKVDFKDLATGVTSKFYAKKVTDKRSSPHTPGNENQNDPQGAAKKYTGVMPKTQEEFDSMYNDRNIPIDHKLEITDYWNTKQTA